MTPPSAPIEITIHPGTGRAHRIERGAKIQITDPQGGQVADFWAFSEADEHWLSTSYTRDITERLFPALGECFYGDSGEPMLTFLEDQSSGTHDMLFPACNPKLYEREGLMGHKNCHDNFVDALAEIGVYPKRIPDPVNFFQNSPPRADGRLFVLSSKNPPGGYITLRAEQDLTIIVTACAIDFHPTNGGICTEIKVKVS